MISSAEQGHHHSSQMGNLLVLRGREVHRLSLCPCQHQQHRRDKVSARCKKNCSSNDPKHNRWYRRMHGVNGVKSCTSDVLVLGLTKTAHSSIS